MVAMFTGCLRQVDDYGRLRLPRELRETAGIKPGDNVSLIAHRESRQILITLDEQEGEENEKSQG